MAQVSERGLVFGREGNLLGIVSEPARGSPEALSVVLLNAGIVHRVGPSRFMVELARELAVAGFRALRFDLSGIGDSALPRRSATLAEIVRQDIHDAITTVVDGGSGGVVLIGLCSGADNAFHIAPSDERVRGLVLIDPWVHSTWGFRKRKLKSLGFWLRILSGRPILRRLLRRPVLPPDHYGLLTDGRDEARRKARLLEGRGVKLFYILTGRVHSYCSYPEQVAEALDLATDSPILRVEWRPGANHTLTAKADRAWLYRVVREWMDSLMVPPAMTR